MQGDAAEEWHLAQFGPEGEGRLSATEGGVEYLASVY